jgi:aryl-alcohol dehydrogenase-like predicted oxidoreductase
MPDEQFNLLVETLEAIAAEHQRSVPQVALRWVMQRPTVATVVFGARDERQLRDNLAAAGFALTPEQVARLDAASARPMKYPYWHQQATFAERNPLPVPRPEAR